MLNKKIILFIFVVFSGFFSRTVFATTGFIDGTLFSARVCHEVTCSTVTPGVINFKPSGVSSVVVDDVAGMSGYIWGNELGWINLNPTGQGLSVNGTTGAISGKAWSQVSGWVNFRPTGQGVSINANGEFTGWAWTGGPYGGWIKFDCTTAASCVKTTWRPQTQITQNPIGVTPIPLIDVCPNIPEVQTAVPNGYTFSGSNCIPAPIDVCPNLLGIQESIPTSFFIDSNGRCVSDQVDYCPNLVDIQSVIPDGYTVTNTGNCVVYDENTDIFEDGDSCPNILGVQSDIPLGYVFQNGACVVLPFDICPNILGEQKNIPQGKIINEYGECVPIPKDVCSNIAGVQSAVPKYFTEVNGVCLVNIQEIDSNETIKDLLAQSIKEEPILAYSFIPEKFQHPYESKLLANVASFIDSAVGQKPISKKTIPIDLRSYILTATGVSMIALSFLWWLPLAIGLRKWGFVYNVVSRKALRGIEVRILNQEGKILKKVTSDIFGRYGFTVPKGDYSLEIAVPETHQFPARSLEFKKHHVHKNKVIYKNLYHGGVIHVPKSGRVRLNIPLDIKE